MAPRALWTGSIAFGLVNVPVRLYTAVHEHKLQFHLVHAKDDGPIGYEKVCKLEGNPVDSDEIVKRNRQYLGCLRVRGDTLTLEQLHFADEVDPPGGIVPDKLPPVAKRELEMALQLIDGFAGDWKPERYEDTYTDALRELVEAKLEGHEVHRAREPEPTEQPDLMEALRQSVEQARGKPRHAPKKTPRKQSRSPAKKTARK
jgi:DNA end-binding protein Ku